MTALRVVYDENLKKEYQTLFNTCKVSDQGKHYADPIVQKIVAGKARYQSVALHSGCPWWLIGLIHHMEASNDFNKHLHNGDPLSKKTVHVPAGRPTTPPPWTWEYSATDALNNCRHFDKWHDWSLPGCLWQIELFNGLGYRQYHPQTKSPYLWSMTNIYKKGKYVADGRYDPEAVSTQLGVAAILKRGFELKVFT